MSSAHIQQELPDCPASRLMALNVIELYVPTGVVTLVFKVFFLALLQSHLSFWAAHQRYCLLQWCSQTWRGRTGLPPSVWGD